MLLFLGFLFSSYFFVFKSFNLQFFFCNCFPFNLCFPCPKAESRKKSEGELRVHKEEVRARKEKEEHKVRKEKEDARARKEERIRELKQENAQTKVIINIVCLL